MDIEELYQEYFSDVYRCKAFISELLSEDPLDKSIYNKMTKYYTINVTHNQCLFCSAHYGTEMYIVGASDDDIAFFKGIMKQYTEEDFSVHIVR